MDVDAEQAIDRVRVLLQRIAEDGDAGIHHQHVQGAAVADARDDGVPIGAVGQECGTACFGGQPLGRFRRAGVGERDPRAVRHEAPHDRCPNSPAAAEHQNRLVFER
jgi:hypothetical protein